MKQNLLAVKQLDQQFSGLFESAESRFTPKQGWIRTLRKTLGMTIKQLACRLGVSPRRVTEMENAECNKAITLHSLDMAARSLNCELFYMFLPKPNFEAMIRRLATDIAEAQISRTSHTMDLEAQSVDKEWLESQVEDAVRKLLDGNWKHLWEEQ